MKRKLKGWKKADRFYILNMQRGNAFTKEEDTFQMKIIKRLLSFIFLCVIIAGGVLGYKGYEEYKKALSEESVKEMAARIEEQPNYTTIDELPQTYIDAVLSVEDKRFYDHFGVDPIAVGRAFFNDIKAGAYVEGGSTITQQLAKNQYFTQDKKIVRKVAEMFMAFKIESELDKDTIFELYVNSIFFGNGYYCVADASNGYFGKVPLKPDENPRCKISFPSFTNGSNASIASSGFTCEVTDIFPSRSFSKNSFAVNPSISV